MNAVTFSPDGSRLAISQVPAFGDQGGVVVYELEENRGIKSLRGLQAQVEKTCFSPDGRLVAGLAQDWQIAIWDRATTKRLRVLDLPRGHVADNASFAFSPDGSRLVFSAGRDVRLLNVESGEVAFAWSLPDGLTDSVAFCGPNHLLIVRAESRKAEGNDGSKHPSRHLILREILGSEPPAIIREISDFERVADLRFSPDGRYFVAEGVSCPPNRTRTIVCYEGSTGKQLWSHPSTSALHAGGQVVFDPLSHVLAVSVADGARTWFFELPSGRLLADKAQSMSSLGPDARIWLSANPSTAGILSTTYGVMEQTREEPLFQVVAASSSGSQFSSKDRCIAWGNIDGSVTLVDINMIEERLASLGSAW
jgi:WD40 repeat protein